VYTVIDGFEGDVGKDGPQAGQRVVNGWKNDGLPWTYKLDKDKLYLPQHRASRQASAGHQRPSETRRACGQKNARLRRRADMVSVKALAGQAALPLAALTS
jgi:hypothetical protein